MALLTGSIFRTILKLSALNFWGYLILFLQALVEVFFVSKIGLEEIAALGIVTSMALVSTQLGASFSVAITTLISKEDESELKNTISTFIYVNLILGIILSLFGYFSTNFLVDFMAIKNEKIYHLVTEYVALNFLTLFLLFIGQTISGIFRALGLVHYVSVNMTLYGIVTFTLTPVFIFGTKHTPAFGFFGVILSIVAGRVIATSYFLTRLLKRKILLTPNKVYLKKSVLKEFFKLASITFASNIIIPLIAAVVTRYLNDYGRVAVAAYAIILRLETFFNLVSNAVFTVFIAFLGQNYIKKQLKRIEQSFRYTLLILLFWFLIPALTVFIFQEEFLNFFTDKKEIHQKASLYFKLVLPFLFFENLRFVLGAIFNVFGKIRYNLFILVFKFLFFIVVSYILKSAYGLEGIFISLSISHLIFGLIAYTVSKIVLKRITKIEEMV